MGGSNSRSSMEMRAEEQGFAQTQLSINEHSTRKGSVFAGRSSVLGIAKTFKRSPSKDSGDSLGGAGEEKSSSSYSPMDNGIPIRVGKKLFYGNNELALIPDVLHRRYGVTHILNLCSTFKMPAANSGIVGYKHMEMSDDGDTVLTEFVNDAVAFIKEGMKKGKVFVHCRLGQNRSVTVMLAWLVLVDRVNLGNAIQTLKGKNAIINVHPNYIKQLSALEGDALGTQSVLPDFALITKSGGSTPCESLPDQQLVEDDEEEAIEPVDTDAWNN